MAITVRITPISERPRLLTLGDANAPSYPPPPATSRSASSVSVPDSDSADSAVPADLPSPHIRYLPIRNNSSPDAVYGSRRAHYPHTPRPPMLRAPATSPIDSYSTADLPSSSYSPTSSESDDPWALPPANYVPAPRLPYYPPSTPPTPVLRVRPARTRPNSRVVEPHYLRSRSSLSSSGSSGKSSRKGKDRTRKRGMSGCSCERERSEMTRCGRHGDEWLFEGWGSWFRRFWRE